jgi:archaellum biogenesis ATPase FlaH
MGIFEEKIKQDIMQTIFADSLKMYEIIDGKFQLNDEQKQKLLEKISNFNSDLNELLKDIKLS